MKETTYLFSGLLLGLFAGISPGPILTLVISETLKFNKKEGIKVAFVPLITDIPIVIISIYLLLKVSAYGSILGTISMLGALFLIYLAWESLKKFSINIDKNNKPFSIQKGILANFLSPHPYLFWISVGGPIIFKSYQLSIFGPVFFVSGFYIALVGSKIIVAILVDKSKSVLNNKWYLLIVKTLGFILIIFAVLFIYEGFKHFGFSIKK